MSVFKCGKRVEINSKVNTERRWWGGSKIMEKGKRAERLIQEGGEKEREVLVRVEGRKGPLRMERCED